MGCSKVRNEFKPQVTINVIVLRHCVSTNKIRKKKVKTKNPGIRKLALYSRTLLHNETMGVFLRPGGKFYY